jgi:hypothetical protein
MGSIHPPSREKQRHRMMGKSPDAAPARSDGLCWPKTAEKKIVLDSTAPQQTQWGRVRMENRHFVPSAKGQSQKMLPPQSPLHHHRPKQAATPPRPHPLKTQWRHPALQLSPNPAIRLQPPHQREAEGGSAGEGGAIKWYRGRYSQQQGRTRRRRAANKDMPEREPEGTIDSCSRACWTSICSSGFSWARALTRQGRASAKSAVMKSRFPR